MTKIFPDKAARFVIDSEKGQIVFDDSSVVPLYSPEGFKIVSDLWIKVGWDQKHPYSFTWMGRPLIQIPEDMLRVQEVIYTVKPDVIIETGVAHGGSLVFYASLCKAMERGRVIGVDIEIRPPNRRAIEAHELAEYLTLIEGDSVHPDIVGQVKRLIRPGEKGLVILDSCHDYKHVLAEMESYSSFVSIGSYLVVTDASQEYMHVTPRAKVDYPHSQAWPENNPKRAIDEFVRKNPDFDVTEPEFLFNEGRIESRVTSWPSCYVKRIR